MSTAHDRGGPPSEERPAGAHAGPSGDRPGVPAGHGATGDHGFRYSEVQAGDPFQELRRKLRGFVFPATAAFLAWYLLYVLMSMYARDFMATKLIGEINVAYVFGILQFVTTFGIAYLYSRYAAKNLDPIAERILADMEAGR